MAKKIIYPGFIALVCEAFIRLRLTFLSAKSVMAVPASSKKDQKTVMNKVSAKILIKRKTSILESSVIFLTIIPKMTIPNTERMEECNWNPSNISMALYLTKNAEIGTIKRATR